MGHDIFLKDRVESFPMLCLLLGGLGKLRKNVINLIEIGRSNHEKLKCNDYYMKTILSMLQDVKGDMRQYIFHMKMGVTDVSEFFPIKSDSSLKRFMDRENPDWEARKHGFYHLLFTAITKAKKKFAKAILNTVFTRQYIIDHRWPQQG